VLGALSGLWQPEVSPAESQAQVGGQAVPSFNGRGLHAEAPLAMWPTAAGVGMLVMMLLGALLIGYCVQVGRRKQEEVARIRKLDALQETSLSDKVEKQAEIGQVLDCALSRPSSRGSRVGTAWSPTRPCTAPERRAGGFGRPTSACSKTSQDEGLPRSRQVRTVLESEIMDDEFEWARPATDILSSRLPEGRFTVEDLCTVYLQRQKPRPFTSPEVPRKPAAIRMEDLRDATAAAIFVAEEREALNSPSNVQKMGRSRRHQDVPHKEVWANTCQSNLLFEVWRPPELVKDWEWELPAPPTSLPGGARVKPGRLKRSWTVSSEQWMPTSTRGDEPATRSATAGIRPEPAQSAWLSDNGEFVRPTPLKARIRMEAPVPSPSPPATFHQRAATAAAWVFGRRQVPVPVNTMSQDQDPEAQADLLVNEMREQLKHTCKEPLQVRKLIFRDLQRQLHPDKNTECEEAAKHAFQKLMEERKAYLGAEPAGFGQASESNK